MNVKWMSETELKEFTERYNNLREKGVDHDKAVLGALTPGKEEPEEQTNIAQWADNNVKKMAAKTEQDDSVARYEKYIVERQATFIKDLLFLKDMVIRARENDNVVGVEVSYSGSGDSGQTDGVVYLLSDGSKAFQKDFPRPWFGTEDVTEEIHVHVFHTDHRRSTLANIADSVAHAALEHLYSGWEINDGSSGTLIFSLDDEGELSIESSHDWYVTETDNVSNSLTTKGLTYDHVESARNLVDALAEDE